MRVNTWLVTYLLHFTLRSGVAGEWRQIIVSKRSRKKLAYKFVESKVGGHTRHTKGTNPCRERNAFLGCNEVQERRGRVDSVVLPGCSVRVLNVGMRSKIKRSG